jgi:bis(5'-nucleosyl)-tetraphosphatase (symmetrical)
MATYVIGDVHGRLDALERLLKAVAFDPRVDQAWFVGDLVNRGPRSIETVEFVRALGPNAMTVWPVLSIVDTATLCGAPF